MFFEQIDSSNKQKMNGCFFREILRQKCELVFVLTQENAYLRRFHFKTNRKSIDSFKDILNSSLFKMTAYIYMIFTKNFERF